MEVLNKKKFFLCYFESTRACNINCRYCMTQPAYPSKKQKGKELSTDEIKRLIIDEVRKYTPYSAIAFSGGEHLIREDAMDLLKYTADSGLWSFINTNGKLLNKKKIKEILRVTGGRVVFAFPLNSLTGRVHKWSRDDGLKTIVKAAKRCASLNANFFFILTVSKSNLSTLEKTVEFLKKHKVPLLRSPFVMRGRGELHPELLFDKEDMENIINPVLRDYSLSYISYTPFFASPEYLKKEWEKLSIAIEQFGCQAAKGFVGISAEGDVSPCVHLLDSEVRCGNIRETPLRDILENNEIIQNLQKRDKLKGKCGICRYNMTCGGCRALAYYKTGDYLSEDPSCFFEPESYESISEHEEVHNKNASEFIEFIKEKEPWSLLF